MSTFYNKTKQATGDEIFLEEGQMFQLSDMKAKDKPTCVHLGHWYSVKKDYIIDITPAEFIWHTHET